MSTAPASAAVSAPSGGPALVADLVRDAIGRYPDAVAVEHGHGEAVTYGALAASAAECGRLLRREGVGPGSRVGMAVPRSPAMIAAQLAVWDCGAVPVPLPTQATAQRVGRIVRDCDARAVLTTDPQYALDGMEPTLWIPGSEGAPAAADPEPARIAGSDTAYILYTSGSTGTPKGVVMSHRAFAGTVDWQVRSTAATHAGRPPRQLQFTPSTFDVSFLEIFATLAAAGTLVLPDEAQRRDPELLLDLMARTSCTGVFLPHVVLHAVAEAAASRDGRRLPPLHQLLTGGEQMIVTDQLRAWMRSTPGCVVQNIYGPSETHVVTSHILQGDPGSWPALPPIGHAIPGAELRIVDEDGAAVAPGETGQLYISGPCVADGYLGAPELTAEKFLSDGAGGSVYRSGDHVFELGDGALQFVGRVDGQIKIRGVVVNPTGVEVILTEHPEVRACAVVARERVSGQKHLVAYVVSHDPSRTACAAPAVSYGDPVLSRHLLDRLPEWSVPDVFVFMESLPFGSSGKIDRNALPAAPRRRSVEADGTATPTEARLVLMWSRLLNLDDVRVTERFFELGGDSLLLVRMQKEIEGEFGIDLRIADLIELATIQVLAARLDSDGEPARAGAFDGHGSERRAAFRTRGRKRREVNREH